MFNPPKGKNPQIWHLAKNYQKFKETGKKITKKIIGDRRVEKNPKCYCTAFICSICSRNQRKVEIY